MQVCECDPKTLQQHIQEIRRFGTSRRSRRHRETHVDFQRRKVQQIVETLLFLQRLCRHVCVQRFIHQLYVRQEHLLFFGLAVLRRLQKIYERVDEPEINLDVELLNQQFEIFELLNLGVLHQQLDDAQFGERLHSAVDRHALGKRHRSQDHGEDAVVHLVVDLETIDFGVELKLTRTASHLHPQTRLECSSDFSLVRLGHQVRVEVDFCLGVDRDLRS